MPPQLPPNELEPIREALLAAFTDGDFSLLLSDKLALQLNDIALAAANPTRPARLQAALEWLNSRRRIPELLAAAFERRAQEVAALGGQVEPALAALHEKYRGDILDIQLKVDHYLACRVASGLGMVDREGLRRELVRLKNDQARILLISGLPTSGKTYTRMLLDHVAHKTGDFQPIILDLRPLARLDPDKKVAPDVLAKKLAADIGAPPPEPIDQRTGPAWAFDTCNWLVTVLAARPQTTYWLVVDHLSKVAFHPGVEELFIEIALRLDESLGNLRLILIDYSPKVEDELRALGLQRPFGSETVPPISLDKLAEFFARVYQERQLLTQAAFTADEVGQTVARCWNVVAENDPARLKRLGDEIALVLGELFA